MICWKMFLNNYLLFRHITSIFKLYYNLKQVYSLVYLVSTEFAARLSLILIDNHRGAMALRPHQQQPGAQIAQQSRSQWRCSFKSYNFKYNNIKMTNNNKGGMFSLIYN